MHATRFGSLKEINIVIKKQRKMFYLNSTAHVQHLNILVE